jgi:hypothetical protein
MYAAPPGRKIAQADQSGAEALIVAYESRPGAYRRIFQLGYKPHTFLALRIFWTIRKDWFVDLPLPAEVYANASVEELPLLPGWKTLDSRIKKSGSPYDIGKRTCHAKSYMMGVKTFILQTLKESKAKLFLTVEEAKIYLAMFEFLFSEIIEWQREIREELETKHELFNLFGFPRKFEQRINEAYVREAVSWKPQSTVAIITHNAIAQMQNHIEASGVDWHVISNKHDSAAVEAPTEEAPLAGEMLQSFLKAKLTGRDGAQYEMRSEIQIGQRWCKRTAIWPDGMTDYEP